MIVERQLVQGSLSTRSGGFDARHALILELGQLLEHWLLERVVEVEGIRMVRVEIDDDFLRLVGVES